MRYFFENFKKIDGNSKMEVEDRIWMMLHSGSRNIGNVSSLDICGEP